MTERERGRSEQDGLPDGHLAGLNFRKGDKNPDEPPKLNGFKEKIRLKLYCKKKLVVKATTTTRTPAAESSTLVAY